MIIQRVVTGFLNENCYIVSYGNEFLIVDPGDDFDKIIKKVGDKKVLGVLITHYHFDHIGALDEVIKRYHVSVIDFMSDKFQNIGKFNFEIIPTYGHTNDSVTYYFKKENIMFTGDFLFKLTIGRCDLSGGDKKLMMGSINKIKKYSPFIKIYPGHGEESNLGFEFDNNSFLGGNYA